VITPAGAPIAAKKWEALVVWGGALFKEKGCHAIGIAGTSIGPDLSHGGPGAAKTSSRGG
jgi:hypothetical protein